MKNKTVLFIAVMSVITFTLAFAQNYSDESGTEGDRVVHGSMHQNKT